jgi:steroid delta-isomerase-like uncharacterized protein
VEAYLGASTRRRATVARRGAVSGDLDGAAALFSPDCTHVTPAGQQDANGWKAFAQAFRNALPDAHMEIVSVVEAGDAVAVEARFRGTHKGALATPRGEVPASGNAIDVPFADFFRLGEDMIDEHRVYWDQAEMIAQLSPSPPS